MLIYKERYIKLVNIKLCTFVLFNSITACLRFDKNSAGLDTADEKPVNKIRIDSLLQNTYIDSQVFSVQILQQEEFVVLLQERETAKKAGKLPSCFANRLSGGGVIADWR